MAAAAEQLDIDAPADADGKVPFYKTPMGKNILRGAAVAAILVAILIGWMWSRQPDYKVLFANFSDRDGGAITAALDQMQIKYKFSEGGNAIMIPENQVHDVRLRLASQGLPKGGNVGFELMENQKLGISQFLEQVNYQRALEGELAKSIESLGSVQSARVHLAMPKPSVFVREQQKPTASVVLTLHPNRSIDPGQVSAIVHLVASSVPELMPANVTVVDQQGNLLSDQNKDSKTSLKGLDATQLKYVQELQNQVIKQVENIVKPIVGDGNVRAEAVADVDFSAIEQAAESYKPNSSPAPSAIRSQQSAETVGNANANPNGVPGALSNQPPGTATAPLTTTPPPGDPAAPGTVPAGTAAAAAPPGHKESTTNYEVDKTVRYEQKAIAGLKRMTVGVVVNYRRIVDATGKVTVKPLTAAEMANINSLVREAMGYNQDRGDSVSVANAPFDGIDKPADPVLDWWRDPANLPLASEIAKFLIVALILLYILLRVVRPMMRPVFKKIDEINAPEPEPEEEIVEEPAGPTPEEIMAAQMAELDEKTARTYRDNLMLAKKLANDDPRIVANVIKAWIGNND